MKVQDIYKSRKELAAVLAISTRTLERKLTNARYKLRKGTISPQEQEIIKKIVVPEG